jgi:hypothetical protein
MKTSNYMMVPLLNLRALQLYISFEWTAPADFSVGWWEIAKGRFEGSLAWKCVSPWMQQLSSTTICLVP